MKTPKHTPLSKLRHHVTGAIERGEAKPIESIVTPKHTKGPWKINKATYDGEVINISDKSKAVDIQLVNNTSGPENWKNAHLISAAPEMLTFLIHLSKLNLRDHRIENRIQKLIKKAKGLK